MTRCSGMFQVLTIATWMFTQSASAQPIRILEHDIPHAAPFFADVDGDGKKDLLVVREAMIATQNLACANAWRAAHSDAQGTNRHGSVWLIER